MREICKIQRARALEQRPMKKPANTSTLFTIDFFIAVESKKNRANENKKNDVKIVLIFQILIKLLICNLLAWRTLHENPSLFSFRLYPLIAAFASVTLSLSIFLLFAFFLWLFVLFTVGLHEFFKSSCGSCHRKMIKKRL